MVANSYELPWIPTGQNYPLDTNTLSIDAVHYNNDDGVIING